MLKPWLGLSMLLLGSACKPRLAPESMPEAQQFSRRIFGPATPYQPLQAEAAALAQSLQARREHAWRVVQAVLKPVQITLPDSGRTTLTVPAWQTWYDAAEFSRMFRHLYKCRLSTAERRRFKNASEHGAIPSALIDKLMAEQPRFQLTTYWTEARFSALLGQLQGPNDLAGLNGVDGGGVSLFSPALIRHYLENAAAVYHCDVKAGSRSAPDVFGRCLDGPFPADAVAIKTAFNRRETGAAIFDTSADAMRARFDPQGANPEKWNQNVVAGTNAVADFSSDASLDNIYHVRLRKDDSVELGTRMLVGMHIATKEIPSWFWLSLWWSPTPDSDFGSDRPALPSPWNQYKMCTVADFLEQDPSLLSNTDDGSVKPEIRASLAAMQPALGASSWCSNPFMEHMPRGANSNCLGCHQYSGAPDAAPVPSAAVPLVREQRVHDFGGDFLLSFAGARDNFQAAIYNAVSLVDAEGATPSQRECELESLITP